MLQNIPSHEECTIAIPNNLEDKFVQQRESLIKYMTKAIEPLEDFRHKFDEFRELLIIDEEKYAATIKFRAEMYLKQQQDAIRGVTDGMTEFLKTVPPNLKVTIEGLSPLSPTDLRVIVHEKLDLAKHYAKVLPEVVHCGCFLVKTYQLKNTLINKCEQLAQAVAKVVTEIAMQKSVLISQLYYAINRKLTAKNKSIEEVNKMEIFIKGKLDPLVAVIKQNIQTMNEYYLIGEELFQTQNNSQSQQKWKTSAFPKDIVKQVEKSLKII